MLNISVGEYRIDGKSVNSTHFLMSLCLCTKLVTSEILFFLLIFQHISVMMGRQNVITILIHRNMVFVGFSSGLTCLVF